MSAFIIKLALVGSGDDTVFRRIPVQMTEAHTETFSFPELKRHAILLSLGEDPSSTTVVDVNLYKVVLVYTDIDGDKAMIASDADLEEAIQQFRQNGSVKVFANVEKNKDGKAPSRESAAESSTQTVHAAAADSTTQTVRSTSSSSATQTARSSATTFASSSAHASASSSANAPAYSSFANASANRRSHKAPKPLHEVVESFVNAVATAVISVADQIQPLPPVTATTNANTTPAPFIHGRHTCDGCLTTPIIGTRYFATNLPDYDLCSQCKENYKGTEIKFQAVELDRDRPFQERWQRRANMTGNCAGRRHTGCSRNNPRGPGTSRPRRCGGGRFAHRHPEPSPPVDVAVKEAIRRSLEDAKKAEKQADAVAQTCDIVVDKEEETTQPKACNSDELKLAVERESDDVSTDSMPELVPRPASTSTVFKYRAALPIYTMKPQAGVSDVRDNDFDSIDSMSKLLTRDTAREDQAGVSDVEDSDDKSGGSMPGLALSRADYCFYPTAPPANSAVPKEVDIVNKGGTETSFASDAEGSGEIATVLGETLDRVAQAIEDLNSDLERTPPEEEKEIVVEAVKDKKGDEDEISNISQSAEDDDCDSWNMVADDN